VLIATGAQNGLRYLTDGNTAIVKWVSAKESSVSARLKAVAKSSLPPEALKELRRYRALNGSERLLFARLRVLSGMGLASFARRPDMRGARTLIFVCFGNIMRSPMCEALLKRTLPEPGDGRFVITSAGLHAVPGREAHPWAIAAARNLDISLEDHRARLLSTEMVDSADVIFAMDYCNFAQILSRWKTASKKLFMLGAYAPSEYRETEIPDPYHATALETVACYKVLGACVQNLAHDLASAKCEPGRTGTSFRGPR
jgi:protein-tyrosine-phosphatase